MFTISTSPFYLRVNGGRFHVQLFCLFQVLVCRLHDRLAAYQSDDTDQSAWADVEQLCIQVCTLLIRLLKNNLSHCTGLFHNGVGGEPLVGHKPTDVCSTLLVSATVRSVRGFFCLPACLPVCLSVRLPVCMSAQSNRDSIIAAGALPLLVAFLRSQQPAVQQAAAKAFWHISRGSQQNKAAIVAAGGVHSLVATLKSPACLCMSVCLCLPACWVFFVSVRLPACLCMSVCLCLLACRSVLVSVCLPACLSAFVSVCLSACLSARPFFSLV